MFNSQYGLLWGESEDMNICSTFHETYAGLLGGSSPSYTGFFTQHVTFTCKFLVKSFLKTVRDILCHRISSGYCVLTFIHTRGTTWLFRLRLFLLFAKIHKDNVLKDGWNAKQYNRKPVSDRRKAQRHSESEPPWIFKGGLVKLPPSQSHLIIYNEARNLVCSCVESRYLHVWVIYCYHSYGGISRYGEESSGWFEQLYCIWERKVYGFLWHLENWATIHGLLTYGYDYYDYYFHRLKNLEKFVEKVNEAIDTSDKTDNYLFNPVNAFQLVNRYKNGWLKLHENIYTDNSQGTILYCYCLWGESLQKQLMIDKCAALLRLLHRFCNPKHQWLLFTAYSALSLFNVLEDLNMIFVQSDSSKYTLFFNCSFTSVLSMCFVVASSIMKL